MENISVKQFVVKDFHAAEALKSLRTNLIFSGESVRAVALTSCGASEGKSTVSFQLAASLAQTGKRVLLLDTDLRKSVLVKRLRVHRKLSGLSHYLSGICPLEETIVPTDVEGLSVIFAGTHVPNSAELLGGKNFEKLVPILKEKFDFVIVDAAPLGQVIDCAVIAPLLDGVIMVIDSTNNSYKLERRVQAQLVKSGGKILGAVLNRVNFKDKGSYYGKAYGYGYGYGEEAQEKD